MTMYNISTPQRDELGYSALHHAAIGGLREVLYLSNFTLSTNQPIVYIMTFQSSKLLSHFFIPFPGGWPSRDNGWGCGRKRPRWEHPAPVCCSGLISHFSNYLSSWYQLPKMLLIKAFIQLSQDGHTRYITLFKIIFSRLSARSKMLSV